VTVTVKADKLLQETLTNQLHMIKNKKQVLK